MTGRRAFSDTTGRIVSALSGVAVAVIFRVALGAHAAGQSVQPGSATQTAARCRIDGRITSGSFPLPGVSVVVQVADVPKAATSTDLDGKYTIFFTPNATYGVVVDLTGFTGSRRDVTVGEPPCDQTVDFQLALQPRTARRAPAGRQGAEQSPRATSAEAAPPAPDGGPDQPAAAGRGRGGRGGGPGGGGRAAGAAATGGGAERFQSLPVQTDASGAALLDPSAPGADDVARLLPPGFSLDAAQADAIALNGSGGATAIDRGLMTDRLRAIALGQFDPATGQFAPGFGPPDGAVGLIAADGFDAPFGRGFGGPGGPGGPVGGSGRGGGRGGPEFFLGGRGARGQRPYQGSVNYTFGGSMLDSAPYQLRPDVPVTQPLFAKNNFGATFGGPLKIPKLYANANRRTNFQVNYTGNQSNNVFDQYATVPTAAMRNGDFAASPFRLIDPATGKPFPGNQIPAGRIDSASATLLPFVPSPNLPGTSQNYHVSTTAHTSSEAVSLRLTQNLSRNVPPGGGGPGGRGGFGGFGGGGGGFGGGQGGGPFVGRGTNIVLNAQLQYRHNDVQTPNVFPGLGGETQNTTLSAPITLLVRRGRSVQNISVNLTHSSTESANAFTNTENVATLAGIQYPSSASTDPLNWGVPNLAFSGFTGVRGASASARHENRLTASYAWMRPTGRQQIRIGGNFRVDGSDSQINSNARGSFTFTGLYSSGGAAVTRATGADFADFLLGLPQQATLQVGGTSRLRQRAFAAYIEDNWQPRSKLTFNLGLRYELARPYVELNGRMANLDVTPSFTAASPVLPNGVGPYTGSFPAGLLNTDANNLGPRLGMAYRIAPNTILRAGYSITYNSGSYASIARELVGQPPFAETETIAATATAPLTLAEALLSSTVSTTNNWGVDRDYALGTIQTWNAALTRNLNQNWLVSAAYTGVEGTGLDILRAPSLGASGPLIPGVQPFIWESSGGRSFMNAGNVQFRRRLANGYAGGLSYTLAKSMDDASSLGAGGPIVAQNDKDLHVEYARSSFDRRHQVSGDLYVELPWGPNHRWLNNGGTLAALFGAWSAQLALTLQSGTPLTARVLGAATDLLRGVNGSLRANYNGGPVQLSNPTVDEFFNVTAFSAPAVGQFGDSLRNMIVGPGARQLNGSVQRDIRLGGNRALTLQINALNLLNTVQWASVDTNVNSRTFGYVLAARPMRTVTITARFRY